MVLGTGSARRLSTLRIALSHASLGRKVTSGPLDLVPETVPADWFTYAVPALRFEANLVAGIGHAHRLQNGSFKWTSSGAKTSK